MRRMTYLKWPLIMAVCTFIISCTEDFPLNDFSLAEKQPDRYSNVELTKFEAQQWYESNYEPVVTTRTNYNDSILCMMKPDWKHAKELNRQRYEVVELPIMVKGGYIILDEETAQEWTPEIKDKAIRNTAKIVIERDKNTGRTRGFVMIFVGSHKYLKKTKTMGKNTYLYREQDFDGSVLFYELNGTFVNGWGYKDGKIVTSISPKLPKDAGEENTGPETRAMIKDCHDHCYTTVHQECYEHSWAMPDQEFGFSFGSTMNCFPVYTEECTTHCDYYDDGYNTNENWNRESPSGGSNTPSNEKNNNEKQPETVSKDPVELMDKKKFEGWRNGANCYELCKATLKNYGLTYFGSPSDAFRLAYEKNKKLLSWGNNPSQNYSNAIRCIDEHLNAGRPIIVGVSYDFSLGYNEGTTDHFIVITGRGFDSTIGEYYYTFMDNATSDINKGCSPDNRLFYDGDTYFGGNSMAGKLYNVTQVRPNNGKKYDTTSITRSIINFNFYNYENLFTSFSPDFWLN